MENRMSLLSICIVIVDLLYCLLSIYGTMVYVVGFEKEPLSVTESKNLSESISRAYKKLFG